MKTTLISLFTASLFAGAAALALLGLDRLFHMPSLMSEAQLEEAVIFNADDAQWFGEEPSFGQVISLVRVDRREGAVTARLTVDDELRRLAPSELVTAPCLRLAAITDDDAVLLDNCGSYALLSSRTTPLGSGRQLDLPPVEAGIPSAPGTDAGLDILDLRDNARVTALLRDYRQRVYERPLSLRGRIEVELRQGADGRQYYIHPGSDAEVFALLPLRSGDQVIGINGVPLRQRDALSELYQRFDSAVTMVLTLRRDGRDRVLLLTL